MVSKENEMLSLTGHILQKIEKMKISKLNRRFFLIISKFVYTVKEWENKPCKAAMHGYKIANTQYVKFITENKSLNYFISKF